MNAEMPQLKRAFERAGFTNVKTVLSSGNVVFDARSARGLERKAEAAIAGRFVTIVRPVAYLSRLIAADPYGRLPKNAKRVVTFLRRRAKASVRVPAELDGVRIVAVNGREVFTAYVPSPRGARFMTLIEKTFGKDVTTRSWQTVEKCARA